MPHDFKNFFDLIIASKSVAIIGHKTPDADAFGSALALREIIRKFYSTDPQGKKLRKRIDVFLENEELPESFNLFLPEHKDKIKFINPEKPLLKYDLVIGVDSLNKERFGKYLPIFESAAHTANIDHHLANTKYAEFNYVAKTSSACESLFYLFIANKNIEPSKYILSLLYAGIITDTFNLKDNADGKLTEKALSYIKQRVGINLISRIRENFFANNSQAKDELIGLAYSKKNRYYFEDGKVCIIVLDNKAFKQTGATLDDAEGIVDEALYRKGVLVSGLILEKEKNQLSVKLRGKQGIDVSKIAKDFGGDGHENKAGFQKTGVVSETLKAVAARCSEATKTQNEQIDDFSSLFE